MKTETLTQTTTTFDDGSKIVEYYNSKDKRHNSNGPAIIWYYENGNVECRSFWFEGKRHNPNGSAYEFYDENENVRRKEFWIDGEELTEKEFNKLQNPEVNCNGKIVEIKDKRYELKLVD